MSFTAVVQQLVLELNQRGVIVSPDKVIAALDYVQSSKPSTANLSEWLAPMLVDRPEHLVHYEAVIQHLLSQTALIKPTQQPSKGKIAADLQRIGPQAPSVWGLKQILRDYRQQVDSDDLEWFDVLAQNIVDQAILTANQQREDRDLMAKPFNTLSPQERQLITRLIRLWAWQWHKSLRRKRINAEGRLDLSSTFRSSLSTLGIPIRLHKQQVYRHRPELCLWLDVSGSMLSVSHFFFEFARAILKLGYPVQVACYANLGIRLTRPNPKLSLADHPEVVKHIGQRSDQNRGLAAIWQQSKPLMNRHTTVIVCSDARSNHAAFDQQWWQQCCQSVAQVIWCNPEPQAIWGTTDSISNQLNHDHLTMLQLANGQDFYRIVKTYVTAN